MFFYTLFLLQAAREKHYVSQDQMIKHSEKFSNAKGSLL